MEPIYIYSSYTPAVKECIKRYREKNKEKINENNNKYYHTKMQDPEYKEKLREQARLRYHRRKAKKENEDLKPNDEINENNEIENHENNKK